MQNSAGVITEECAQHVHVAVCKVDESHHAIHHGIAQGYQGVNTAEGNSVDDLLEECVHRN